MGGKQWIILTISGYDPLNILGPAGHKNTNKIQVGGHHRHTTLLMTVRYGPKIMNVTDRDNLEAITITILDFTKAFNSDNQEEIKESKEEKFSQLL